MIPPHSAFRSSRSHFLSYLFLLKVSPLKKSQDRYGICQMATVIKKIEVSRKVSTINFDREKSDPYLADPCGFQKISGTPASFFAFVSLCESLAIQKLPLRLQDSFGFSPNSPLALRPIFFFMLIIFLLYYPPIFNASIIFCFFYKRFFSFYR